MKLLSILLFSSVLFAPFGLHAAMNGGNFEIYADTFSVVQDQLITNGGTFTITNTGGESFATSSASVAGGFVFQGGFQAMERSSLSMSLNANTIALGALSLDSVSSGSVVLNVTTDSTTGYTTSVTEDGNLRKGAGGDNDDINDVSDGSVTAGSEEYGIATTGDGGLLIPDTALNGEVAVAASNDEVTAQQTTIAFKAAIARTSRAGSYSHVVTFSSTANP